ncbi:MAG: bifunctional methylenetetrahydrofolate dehydrogenase/methenyltetrahydrofolate cyclohydrolase FolD [Candidatus Micrarchaeota archaeon]
MATIIDGKKIAEKVLAEVKADADALKARGVTPTLAVILVGDDEASKIYIASKGRKAKEIGLGAKEFLLPKETGEEELLALVESLNADPQVHGILVQFPVPKHISERKVRRAISPAKDVDGLHPCNQGRLLEGDEGLVPCTPEGAVRLLEEYSIELAGKHAVVVGRSLLVGKPLAQMLLNRDATVTICHSRTKNLKEITRQADVLCVAVGRPKLVTADMVKDGVVIVDVGINRIDGPTVKEDVPGVEKVAKKVLVGDVDFDGVSKKASAITPVPGGVGPMTIAMLLRNTVNAAKVIAEG